MNNKNDKVPELVRRAITDYDMLSKEDTVLVGFSGGSDSVCLLSVLAEMGYKVTAAHLNHNMRDTAKRDMDFCDRFCRERNIPFVSKTVKKGTLKNEADAREARYSFFAEVMSERGIDKLATAHNKNDSAETVMLHLLRGASTDGLCGISATDSKVIRPLIYVKKSEVNDYCNENNISYVTDETNLTNKYTRNKLRNIYIPQLENEFNPKLIDTIADNAVLMSYDRDFLLKSANIAYENIKRKKGVDVIEFSKLDRAISSRVAEIMWQKAVDDLKNLSGKYIEEIIKLASCGKSGKGVDLPLNCVARVEYGELILEKKTEYKLFEREIEIDKWYDFPEIESKIGIFQEGKGLVISLDGNEKLLIRNRKQGDRFSPAGLGGSKSVSNYLTDAKLPKAERNRLPLLIANGKVAALGNLRADEEFSKGKRATNYVLVIK
ncbi:MAG: tRNA lysidine(34) synthetase TilS [Clostridia bacterium]|nr:tRNA lysidine(34) synthetase TilS [Clostridia bacterium]